MVWILFSVPCPTPDDRTARDLHEKRVQLIFFDGDIGLVPLP